MPDNKTTHTAVIIPAAGSGQRMGLPIPKQFIELKGVPVLVRTVRCFLAESSINQIVIALPEEHIESTQKLLGDFLTSSELTKLTLVPGGDSRQESVLAGMNALSPETEIVLVHDGARPFVSSEIIRNCRQTAIEKGAAIVAIQVRDTIKQVDDNGRITATIDRRNLWQAQTPQAAKRELLDKAYELARSNKFQGTDEASLLEHADIPVMIVNGSDYNIKITRRDDLKIAEGILEDNKLMKIGHGFDAHRFEQDRQLILGGVTVPYELGLAGHSDADVLTHALIDALLGAMGEGDIGSHFPDNDPQYKNIDSLLLLKEVVGFMRNRELYLGNADITIICQRPRLAAFIPEMRTNIAQTCQVEPEAINIKATTTEKMGFTGREEGIAAHAVALLHSVVNPAIPD